MVDKDDVAAFFLGLIAGSLLVKMLETKCSVCGQPIPKNSTQCPFCRAMLK
jgi:uncharacterized Zn finger protein (UPF0148 family)